MSRRTIWLLVVAVAVSGLVWLWQRPTPLKPPYGPYAERFETLNPHSELTEMYEAIGDQIREREIAEAQVELAQGARTVRVCAEENSGLDLSSYPDTAVVWTGSCP